MRCRRRARPAGSGRATAPGARAAGRAVPPGRSGRASRSPPAEYRRRALPSAAMADQPRVLLVVHHTSSPSLQEMLEAVLSGAHADGIEGVDVRVRAALAATSVDVLEADG